MEKPWVQPIRRLLTAKGWTQAELSEQARIRPSTLSEAMNGRSPRMETMEAIAAAFGVPLWMLFVSQEQSLLLRQAEQSQQQLVKQEDLETRILKRLVPLIATEIAAATALPPAPAQPSTQAPQETHYRGTERKRHRA